MRSLRLVALLLAAIAASCGRSEDATAPAEPASPSSTSRPESPEAPRARPPEKAPDREEVGRRQEAVRRAAEELALRGIKTSDYLMNLIAEDEVYRVAFVKRQGVKLKAEIRVRVRRDDFEILGIEGLQAGDR